MRAWAAAWIALAALTAAACGGAPTAATTKDELYEARAASSGGVIDVIDARSHAVQRTLPLGVPSPDWKHLYSVVGTSLVDTDPGTGATLRILPLRGAYRLPPVTAGGLPGGLSPNGAWLVVEAADGTNMLVIDTATWQMRRRLDLGAEFRFDAVSNTGDSVYLIQYVAGKEYFVRLYDVALGRLESERIVDKNEGGEAMTGVRISGVPSTGGQWLYSMYVRDHATPFIHALNLGAPYALCIDLPGGGFGDDPQGMRWTLAMDPTGAHLYATNAAAGLVVQLDVNGDSGASVTRQARIDQLPASPADTAARSSLVLGDVLVVAAGSGVVWIDTRSLAVTHVALADWAVTSVASSPDGRTVYAVDSAGSIAALARDTGAVKATFNPGADHPLALLRVAAS